MKNNSQLVRLYNEENSLHCEKLNMNLLPEIVTRIVSELGELDRYMFSLTCKQNFYSFHFECLPDLCALAAGAGDIRLLEWLVENRREIDVNTCNSAAANGRIVTL